TLTGFRYLRLRIGVKIPRNRHQPLIEPLVSQLRSAEFLFSPIPRLGPLRRRLRCSRYPFALTQQVSRRGLQCLNQHFLDRHVLSPRCIVPSDPFIPRLQPPRRRRKCQPSQISVALTVNQIPHLSPAQRPRSQIVILVHHFIPFPRCAAVRTSDRDQLDRPQV